MNGLTYRDSHGLNGRSATPSLERLPLHLLNETEKECLRLVEQGFTSRRIAEKRHVRRDTVDKILRGARDKTGAPSRGELARQLVRQESLEMRLPCTDEVLQRSPPVSESVGEQSVGLADTPEMPSSDATETPSHGSGGISSPTMVKSLVDLSDVDILRRLLLGSHRSPRNELDRWSEINVISVITAGSALTALALMPLLIVLDRIAVGG